MTDVLKRNNIALNDQKNDFKHFFLFALNELHKTTSKDVIRKLIIRCINQLNIEEIKNTQQYWIGELKSNLINFLNDSNVTISHKSFILNIYMEDLNEFGKMTQIRVLLLNYFILILIFLKD
jgi:uncharacterized protein (DUF1499 family)